MSDLLEQEQDQHQQLQLDDFSLPSTTAASTSPTTPSTIPMKSSHQVNQDTHSLQRVDSAIVEDQQKTQEEVMGDNNRLSNKEVIISENGKVNDEGDKGHGGVEKKEMKENAVDNATATLTLDVLLTNDELKSQDRDLEMRQLEPEEVNELQQSELDGQQQQQQQQIQDGDNDNDNDNETIDQNRDSVPGQPSSILHSSSTTKTSPRTVLSVMNVSKNIERLEVRDRNRNQRDGNRGQRGFDVDRDGAVRDFDNDGDGDEGELNDDEEADEDNDGVRDSEDNSDEEISGYEEDNESDDNEDKYSIVDDDESNVDIDVDILKDDELQPKPNLPPSTTMDTITTGILEEIWNSIFEPGISSTVEKLVDNVVLQEGDGTVESHASSLKGSQTLELLENKKDR
ncbi:hypothetical protein HDU76_004092 [Blyttiomyces sp. JEL0837]|nr:hypothetical protein HDU76_004092 [Blyttiomyces sp. JEL0837]